ncbi:hypothetical protein Bbelb_000030 [Branchiostoma belcheri]|nr:hypothetical protein Bbelb_000030 [Branchiostoma belcheri]
MEMAHPLFASSTSTHSTGQYPYGGCNVQGVSALERAVVMVVQTQNTAKSEAVDTSLLPSLIDPPTTPRERSSWLASGQEEDSPSLKVTTLQDIEEGLVTTLSTARQLHESSYPKQLDSDPAVRPSAAGISPALKNIVFDDDLAEVADLNIKDNEDSEGDSTDGATMKNIDGGEGDEEDNSEEEN